MSPTSWGFEMRFRRYALIGGALAALAAGPSLAEYPSPPNGPYLRGEAGISFETELGSSSATGPSFTQSPGSGPILGGALGLRMAPFRFELGVDWMTARAGSGQFTNDDGLGAAVGLGSLNGLSGPLSGSIDNRPVMANLLYDIDTGTRFEPYLGVGVGADLFSAKIGVGGTTLFDSSRTLFAYQPMVGVNYNITDRLQAGLQYRYFRTVDAKITDEAGHSFTTHNASHNVLASLTYNFGTPAPPPAPAAPPPVVAPSPPPPPAAAAPATPAPKEFIVYFDFDKAALTTAGTSVLAKAIAAYRQSPSMKIVLRGYTDAVGTEAYNLELSRRRALAVSSYLARHGVAKSDMDVGWEGKKNLVVQTNKPERLNRRVEIQM